MKTLLLRSLFAFLALTVFLCRPTPGQQPKLPNPAPIPAQIAAAQKVFISNSGAECRPFGKVSFGGGPDRVYDEFYAGIKTWGRHTVVGAPSDSDLVMEIHFQCPIYVEENIVKIDPQFRLVLLDPKTHVQLWAIVEHFNEARLQGNRDKDFDVAMGGLLDRLRDITALAAAGPKTP